MASVSSSQNQDADDGTNGLHTPHRAPGYKTSEDADIVGTDISFCNLIVFTVHGNRKGEKPLGGPCIILFFKESETRFVSLVYIL
jgi:hypothetical protein